MKHDFFDTSSDAGATRGVIKSEHVEQSRGRPRRGWSFSLVAGSFRSESVDLGS